MMDGESAALRAICRREVRSVLGAYEHLRGYLFCFRKVDLRSPNSNAAAIAGLTHAAGLSQAALLPVELTAPRPASFPQECFDQIAAGRFARRPQFLGADDRPKFSSVELLETHLVQRSRPFVLMRGIKDAHDAYAPSVDKHIVNVSAS
jgi:hypothetical protein